MQDWYLTDEKNELHGWQFPATLVLGEDDYLVVFASGLDEDDPAPPEGEWHTDFRLRAVGEYLALVRPDGTTITSEYEPVFPEQRPDVSYGLTAGLDDEAYFTTPTPGEPNPPLFKKSVFSPQQGFYVTPIAVALDRATLGETIHYTTDGSLPTPEDSLYDRPILIDSTTTVRARSFGPADDGTVYTQTYLFLAGVPSQSATPAGFPSEWTDVDGNTVPADYAFDAEVAGDPAYVGSLSEDLLALPSVMLTMDPDDLFDPQRGIYANPLQSGAAWERPVSLELIHPTDPDRSFQVDAGIRIQGGTSRPPANSPKHSFRIVFKGEYGPSILEQTLLSGVEVDEFDRLSLTAGFQDSWLHPEAALREGALLMRDQWVRDTHRDMG